MPEDPREQPGAWAPDERAATVPDDQTGPIQVPAPPLSLHRLALWAGLIVALGAGASTALGWTGSCVGWFGRDAIAQEAKSAAEPALQVATEAKATAQSALAAAQAAAAAAEQTSKAVTAFAQAATELHGAMICLQIPKSRMPALSGACSIPQTRRRAAAEISLTETRRLLREWEARRTR